MHATGFVKLLSQFQGLSVDQICQAKEALKDQENQREGLFVLRERETSVTCCPHCSATSFVRYGRRGGRQRYRCKEESCGKTFNVLTGTPLARLRQPEKHIENAKCMAARSTLREASSKLKVAMSTAFRWRHRFLKSMATMPPNELVGIVEVDETFFLESFKGQRSGLTRKAKKRGTSAAQRGLSREQIPVLVARDRSQHGNTLTQRLEARDAKHISSVLIPRLVKDKDVVLVSDSASVFKMIGRAHRIEVRQVPRHPKHRTTGLTHINNVNNYTQRLKSWMIGFVGIATKYLANYLGWHRWLDANRKTKTGRHFLEASIGWALRA